MTFPGLSAALLFGTLTIAACASQEDTGQSNTDGANSNLGGKGGISNDTTGGNSGGVGGNSDTGTGGKSSKGVGGNSGSGTGGTFSNGTTAGGNTSAGSGTLCTPGGTQPVITDCGYPFASSNPLTSVVFTENEFIRAVVTSGGWPTTVRVFFNDEHALMLGVRSVDVSYGSGVSSTSNFPVSQLLTNPGSVTSPQTGSHALQGDEAGLDSTQRPLWPSLFVTDVTNDPNDHSGDWQYGGWPFPPDAVYGTWKAAVRTVDKTTTPSVTVIRSDSDPAKNNWDLGSEADPVPSLALDAGNEGFSSELVWNIALVPGHLYRMQATIVDCDQDKTGCHAGEACIDFCASGEIPDGGIPTPLDGGPQPPPCDPGPVCDSTHDACPQGMICANNCCAWLLD